MNRIKEIREEAGISQARLYRALGWSQGRMSNYEQGTRRVGLEEARSVVSALNSMGCNCTLDEVFPPAHAINTEPMKAAS